MQTTLRIDDELYREAKAMAAREGITLTSFLEEALRLRLRYKPPAQRGGPNHFRVFRSSAARNFSPEEIKRIADEEQEKHDLTKLGMRGEGSE